MLILVVIIDAWSSILLSMLFLHLICGNVEVIALNINESDFVNNVTGKPVCQRFAKCRVAANWKGTVVRECVVTPKDEEYQLLLQASVSGLSIPQSFAFASLCVSTLC